MTAPVTAPVFAPARLRPDLPPGADDAIRRALAEDIGRGDLTTRLTVAPDRRASALLAQKAPGVLAGASVFEAAFALYAPDTVEIAWLVPDGSATAERRAVALLRGSAHTLLTAERVALNFVQRLSGVATQARRLSEAIAHTATVILDTRKTTPGLRALEKYAARVGGARNHRFGLDDAILIKDNHLIAAGGITAAVRAARAGCPIGLKIEVEVVDLDGLDEAIAAGADIVLLDNMTPAHARAAVARAGGRVLLEASGGMTAETVIAYAEAGVDFISVGALTHSAPAIDFSLEFTVEATP